MIDVLLNLNCSEHAIYSKLLCGCDYIIKYGLNSPDTFLRRVNKRQAKRLRKKGININVPGCEHAVAENILHNLKVLPSPLIPTNLYTKLCDLLNSNDTNSRKEYLPNVFKTMKPEAMYVLQALLMMLNLMGAFEFEWNCQSCGKSNKGNNSSSKKVSLSLTSYILREKPENNFTGHWFGNWGQKSTDVEVVKMLIANWDSISKEADISSLTIRPINLEIVKNWHCHLINGTHAAMEPTQIHLMEVENMISPIRFPQKVPTTTGDIDKRMHEWVENTINNEAKMDNCTENMSLKAQQDSMFDFDYGFLDNIESLQSIKDRLYKVSECSISSLESECLTEEDVECKTPNKGMAEEMLAGCGSGTAGYDMWSDYQPPSQSVIDLSGKYCSYFTHPEPWQNFHIAHASSKQKRSRKRHMLEKIVSFIQSDIDQRKMQTTKNVSQDHECLQVQELDTDSITKTGIYHLNNDKFGNIWSESKRLKNIGELEKIANRITPNNIPNFEKPQKSNSFTKPPHLIKEFIPKRNVTPQSSHHLPAFPTVTALELKPIKLDSIEPKNEAKTSAFQQLTHEAQYPNTQFQYMSYSPYPAELVPTLPQAAPALPGTSIPCTLPTPIVPILPPLPQELASSTPPNLKTVMVLSQLYSSKSAPAFASFSPAIINVNCE